MNKPIARLVVLAFAITIVFLMSPSTSSADKMKMSAFQDAMDKLWEDHIIYTRHFIISFAANLPDQPEVTQRLLQNQTDIGNAIKPYYGDAAGTKLTALLKDHILGAVEVLKAAKAGNKAQLDAANAKWHANGEEIAGFLSSANPKNWPAATMKTEMNKHLDLTLKEASDRMSGKFADDIKAFDEVHTHILHLADTLSSGIQSQFPDKFM